MKYLIFAALLILITAYMVWDRRVPSEAWLLSEAEAQMHESISVQGEIECFKLTPVRSEERQSADAWLACRHHGMPDGRGYLFWWNDNIERTRGLHFGRLDVDLDGSNRWTR